LFFHLRQNCSGKPNRRLKLATGDHSRLSCGVGDTQLCGHDQERYGSSPTRRLKRAKERDPADLVEPELPATAVRSAPVKACPSYGAEYTDTLAQMRVIEAAWCRNSIRCPLRLQSIGGGFPRRHSCARSESYSQLYSYRLSERTLTVRGVRITVTREAGLIAVFIRLSNARPHVQETADFASAIHSQRMPPNLEGAIAPPVR